VSAGLRERAVRLLARREYTRRELARRLAAHAGDPAEVERVLDELQARGWLSEARATEQLIHARSARYGVRRIAHDLRERGVSEETVAAALPQLKAGEFARAQAVWRRKFRAPPGNATERARQVRFLQGRGFDLEVALRVIEGDGE